MRTFVRPFGGVVQAALFAAENFFCESHAYRGVDFTEDVP
jgi:hypothetical protein